MNIFIVEDSLLIQNRLVRFVEEMPDMTIVGIAADSQSAEQAILNNTTDAIIMDVQLVDGNSFQLLKTIKQHKPNIKVLVLTNHSTESNRLHAQRGGADDFLDKSTDFNQVPTILQKWQSTLEQDLPPHLQH
jgi:DNA-binding NarL/FixJ family response regulator